MTTDRPYRTRMPRESAIAELQSNTGTQFDPRIVSALMKVVERAPDDARRHRRCPRRPRRRPGHPSAGAARELANGELGRRAPQAWRKAIAERPQTSRPPTPAAINTGLTPEASMRAPPRGTRRANAQALNPSLTPKVRAITLSSTVVWMSSRS